MLVHAVLSEVAGHHVRVGGLLLHEDRRIEDYSAF